MEKGTYSNEASFETKHSAEDETATYDDDSLFCSLTAKVTSKLDAKIIAPIAVTM